jgi:lambda family phage portal protein
MPLDSLILDQHGQPARRVKGRPRAALGGGWDAGSIGRRLNAVPTAARAINTLIRSYGQAVLARSRYLAANNPYGASAREAYVSAMVGQGVVPAPQLDDAKLKETVNEVWADWTDEADADWLTDFYGLQAIIAGELFEAGEVFVRFRPRQPQDGLTVPLQLQVLPAEMLDVHWNLALDNGARIECGIEFDAIGRRRAYHFWSVFPGTDVYFGKPAYLRVQVPADQVLHIYRPIRAGQVRGIPHTLSMISTLALLDLYDDAELERKRIAALFAAFITRPDRADEDHPLGMPDEITTPSGDIQPSPALEPGVTVDLAPGEDIKFSTPADVGGSYEPFQYRCLLRAAAGAGIPYSDMTGDLRRTSFGSIRAGLIAHRRRIETLQQSIIVYQLCQRVYRRWWTEAVLAGALPVTPAEFAANQRMYQRADWIPPRWDWIDPLKDLEAEQLAVQNGFKSRTEVIKGNGRDPAGLGARSPASAATATCQCRPSCSMPRLANASAAKPNGRRCRPSRPSAPNESKRRSKDRTMPMPDDFNPNMPEPPEEYDGEDEDPGADCGHWSNGRLTKSCALAGTEFCDFECPYRN